MGARRLKISKDLSLPIEAATQTLAFMGKRGGGKTYAAGVFVEELLDAGCQVVVFDPVGTWYGLRLTPKGKPSGYSIPVLGGLRGDIGLTADSGELVAEMLVSTRSSAVLDASNMTDSELARFAEKFVARLHHLMKAAPAPIHLVFEEAQIVAPQMAEKGERVMLNRMKRIIKLGRNCGIGVSLLSQRPQAIHKGVLNQTEMLVAFQTAGVHERKAIKAWMTDKDLDADLVAELPHLAVGDCWVWSPGWLQVTKKLRFREKRTMDASATPIFGSTKNLAPKPLGKSDLAQLESSMGAAAEQAKANDPRELKQKVRKLEQMLASQDRQLANQKPKEVVKEIPVFGPADRKALGKVELELARATTAMEKAGEWAEAVKTRLLEVLATAGSFPTAKAHRMTVKVDVKPQQFPVMPTVTVPISDPNGLGSRHRDMIKAVFRQGRPITKVQLAAIVGLKHTGGTFSTYLSKCRTTGMLSGDAYAIQVTAAGAALAKADGAVQIPEEPEAVFESWCQRLTGKKRDILRALWGVYPNGMTKEAIAGRLCLEVSGGTFSTYLSNLCSLKLVKREAGQIYLNGETFLLE